MKIKRTTTYNGMELDSIDLFYDNRPRFSKITMGLVNPTVNIEILPRMWKKEEARLIEARIEDNRITNVYVWENCWGWTMKHLADLVLSAYEDFDLEDWEFIEN